MHTMQQQNFIAEEKFYLNFKPSNFHKLSLQTVLITGASGFLGNHVLSAVKEKYNVITMGRSSINHTGMHLSYDFADKKIINLPGIDYVIHCASKVHIVPRTQQEKGEFFTINVQGTQSLVDALEKASPKKFVYISSVAVYGLNDGKDISEDTQLLAIDPYGKSKIEAEKLIEEWCLRKNIEYYILRLPLVAGKNAPGNLGGMVKGIQSGRYFSIGKAAAKKSIVLAKDVAEFIATIEGPSGIYNLTDGYHPSFKELEDKISGFLKQKVPFSLPLVAAKLLGYAGDIIGSKFPVNSNKLKKITSTLTFDDAKARAQLHWKPREVLKEWEIL